MTRSQVPRLPYGPSGGGSATIHSDQRFQIRPRNVLQALIVKRDTS
ncbi:hypothetical protein M3E00_02880 [Dietzia cinnamea]|jgi:hypothetical protein|nr:hypothetical protein [Dietzia cinnamea]MCT2097538.1 hypothetical protein [Dietzia cinnamea]